MALTYGFYDSNNGDRVYNSAQFGSLFDGIIRDGVFASVGDHFAVTPSSGLSVSVGSGRAWFNGTWTLSDSAITLTLDAAEPVYNRVDSVVLEVNKNVATRANSIKIVKGTPSSGFNPPSITNSGNVYQYRLANIRIPSGITALNQGHITNFMGTSTCPYVTGPLEIISMDQYITQWTAQWNSLTALHDAQFTSWFEGLESILDENVAANLTAEVTIDPTTLALYTSIGWVAPT